MFIAALFSLIKIWNQSRCPSVDEWIDSVVYIHDGIVFDHKKGNPVICSNMSSKTNLIHKDKYYMFLLICGNKSSL
jgi:hypothetical protein